MGPKIILRQTIGLSEVPLVLKEYLMRLREKIIENRINLYYVAQRFKSNGDVKGSNHQMDEKNQVMKKKKKIKKRFKNSAELDVAEEKIKLDEEDQEKNREIKDEKMQLDSDEDDISDDEQQTDWSKAGSGYDTQIGSNINLDRPKNQSPQKG